MSQKIALRRAIYDSGRTCQTVTEAGYVQEYGNLSMWTASCENGRRLRDLRRARRLRAGQGLPGNAGAQATGLHDRQAAGSPRQLIAAAGFLIFARSPSFP